MEYIFLSKKFYEIYNENDYPEILHKHTRPYIMLKVKIDDLTFAIPLRSHLNHSYGYITSIEKQSGLDFTKTVVISEDDFIDSKKRINIDKQEEKFIKENYHLIVTRFKSFITTYKRKVKNNIKVNKYQFTTLQYFHDELGLK